MILLSFAREVGVDDLQLDKSMLLRLAEAGPLNAALFYRQGRRLLVYGRYLKAQQQFRKAIAADPLSSAAQRELAKLEKLPVPTEHRSAS
jgi:tetratricopeptide (TPR) repeat protein